MSRKKVGIFGTEPVTGKIGGLGIRQLEIARALHRDFEVRLFTPYPVTSHDELFPIVKINYEHSELMEAPVRWADVLYCNNPGVVPLARKYNKPVAVDLLVHEYFEDLEHQPVATMRPLERSVYFSDCILRLSQQLAMGDFFICPSERSRDYYLGILTLLGKLRPEKYLKDPHFRSLIDVIPFGLPRAEPRSGKNLLRGKIPGVGKNDFLIVWGGTLANWFDCTTPLRALARLQQRRPDIKLVFIGNAHPVRGKPTEAYAEAVALARQSGLLGKTVFFYSDWVSFDQRDYYLSESDAGIVTFRDHIENRFSQRIRMLDYLWGNLPILTNPGNVLSDMIEQEKLGCLVPFGDAKALAEKIEWLASHPGERMKIRERISSVKKRLCWDELAQPLVRFCRKPQKSHTLFAGGEVYDWYKLMKKPALAPEEMVRLVPAHPYHRLIAAQHNLKAGRKKAALQLVAEHNRLFGLGLDNIFFRRPLLDPPGDFFYEDLLDLVPLDNIKRLVKARKQMKAGKFAGAEGLIREHIRLFGESPEARLSLGYLNQLRGEHREAVKDFELVLGALPHRYECRIALADSLERLGNTERARELYVGAWFDSFHENEEWLRSQVAIAVARLNKDKHPEYETLDHYLQYDPGNPGILHAKASALERAGKKGQARKLFTEYTESFKEDNFRAGAWFRLARLSPMGERKKMLEKCLKLDPSHTGAKKMLLELKTKKTAAK